MEFLGLDLSKVLTQSLNDWKVYIIPALYVISSIASLKITNATQKKMQNAKKEDSENVIIENNEEKALKKDDEEDIDPMEQANKSMSLFMPIMSLSIAIIAPLGLALYWLINNILMIAERLVLNKFFSKRGGKIKCSKTIISRGKTTTEAIEKGLKQLNAKKNDVEINIIKDENKKSFFSILAPRTVKVEIKLKEEPKEKNSEKSIKRS